MTFDDAVRQVRRDFARRPGVTPAPVLNRPPLTDEIHEVLKAIEQTQAVALDRTKPAAERFAAQRELIDLGLTRDRLVLEQHELMRAAQGGD